MRPTCAKHFEIFDSRNALKESHHFNKKICNPIPYTKDEIELSEEEYRCLLSAAQPYIDKFRADKIVDAIGHSMKHKCGVK